jgi:ABC-type branched-subunit amino acid transport system ATPase component/ABC-type branched-subunit amino acid transport system permease subunit
MRAVVDDPILLGLAGTRPVKVRRLAWIIGSTFACLTGVLLAPLLAQIDGIVLTLLVITAFGAAAIGAFSNLPLTYLGGIVIGVFGALATKWFATGFLAQLPTALPFIILFLVLVLSPRARLRDNTRTLMREGNNAWSAPLSLQAGAGVLLLVGLIIVPTFAGIHLTDWTVFLADTILFLSLGLLVRTSGQVSLCQITFVAIGASTFAHLAGGQHIPWFAALVLASLIAVPIGALLAIPAIRQSGLYLALATLGFGIVVQYLFYPEGYMFGALGVASTDPRPRLSWLNVSSDRGYYYLVLMFAVVTTVVIVLLRRTRLGRLLTAMSASTKGMTSSGASVNVTRVLVFSLSAFLAAMSGVLAGGASQVITASSYSPITSLIYFAVVMISVGGEPWYAILAAAGVVLVPSYIQGGNVASYLSILFGMGAIAYALRPSSGVPLALQRRIDSFFLRRPRREISPRLQATAAVEEHMLAATPAQFNGAVPGEPVETPFVPAASALTVVDVTVRFAGLVAVDKVSIAAPAGQIRGLIGPNGAGKTTLFNVCSGFLSPQAGRVLVDGENFRGAAARARGGLGRTFQQMELFDSLTVRENVALGSEGRFAGSDPIGHVITTRRQRVSIDHATEEALGLTGLQSESDALVGTLSTGQRRLVELARCLAGDHRLLLLDEPSSGLDRVETERFGAILTNIVEQRGVGILLVEHDMALVTSICSHIYVMDFGELIFEGGPRDVVSSPLVKAAYLGNEIPELREFESESIGALS